MTAPLAPPTMFVVRQDPRGPVVDDVPAETRRALARIGVDSAIASGERVALTGGSRGITDVVTVLRTAVEVVTALGAEPVLVPAMGSHGGATAEGQQRILADYGMTAESLGCAIDADMATVELCRSGLGLDVSWSRSALQCDHVIVVNRVKPHTMFSGAVESGIAKMAMIGLGKQPGAAMVHRAVMDHGWDPVVADVVPLVVEHGNVLGGIAIVERSDDRTAAIEGIPGERILAEEPDLLDRARHWMPRLPFPDADLLLVDQIGKNISGAGLDTVVVGRKQSLHDHEPDPDAVFRARHIAVRGLTPESNGNAIGVGLAEFCRTRVLDAADWETTRLNALTSGDLPAAMAPIDLRSDREIIAASLDLAGMRSPADARLLWIPDTLHLGEVAASAAYRADLTGSDDLDIGAEDIPLVFDEFGNLPDHLGDWLDGT